MLDFTYLRAGLSVLITFLLWPIFMVGYYGDRYFNGPSFPSRGDWRRLAILFAALIVWSVVAAKLSLYVT